MALIKCKECGKEVSDQAKACPNCGCELLTKSAEVVDEANKATKKSHLATVINRVKEPFEKINIAPVFNKIKELLKKSIFFRTKKHFIVTVILLLLIWGLVVLWQSGIVFNKIADNIYYSYHSETITYEQAKEKLSKLDMFGDASSAQDNCDALKDSRDAFDKGVASLNAKDYKTAIADFENVIESDTNYNNAQEKIKNCKLQLSDKSYTTAVAYENSLDWFNAYDSYSYVISDDDNYMTAQAKMVEIKQKILDNTIVKLREYKVSNDYESALELISKTEGYASNDILQEYNEHFNTQKQIANVVKFDYNHGPFTLYKRYSSGDIMYTTYIETFNIVDAKLYDDGDIKIKCDITGIVSDWDYCSFDIKCYNAKGFITDSVGVHGSVASYEPFKITDEIFIPADTVRIEFVAD